MSGFKQRLAHLEQKASPLQPTQSKASQKRMDRLFVRLDQVVDDALELLSPEEGERIIQATAQWGANGSGPLGPDSYAPRQCARHQKPCPARS